MKDYVNYGRDGTTLELLMIFFSTAINLVVLLPLLYGVASSSSTKLVVDESFSALIVKSTVQ